MDLKWKFLFFLMYAICAPAAGAKSKRNAVSKLRDVVNAVLFGEEKLETFRKNTQSHTASAEQILAKKQRTHELEAQAVVRLQATKRLLETRQVTEEELREDKVIATAFRELVCADDNNVECPTGSGVKYRTIDGSCNNRDHKSWGRTFTAQERFLPPVYSEGNKPRVARDPRKTLPSARKISNELFKTDTDISDSKITGLVAAWGQLIDHDVTKTPTAGSFDCCDEDVANTNSECFAMEVPADDERFDTCLNFVRSAQFTSDDCISSRREQINELSAYVDATFVYGSSEAELDVLRHPTKRYLLNTTKTDSPKGDLLPEGSSFCFPQTAADFCQHAGDNRVNVSPLLGSMHTLMLREHNRIAQILKERNNHGWDDDTIFQETRKIIGGITQHISYNEWLPVILGPDAMKTYELEVSENQQVDPYSDKIKAQMLNSFAVAAFRYGHTILSSKVGYRGADLTSFEDFPLRDQILNPHMVIQEDGKRIDDLVRFVHLDAASKSDSKFVDDIRDHLFGSHDLPARNLQRGRDHGVPDYLSFRSKCGLSRDLSDIPTRERDIITKLYENINEIDLYAGGISETRVEGGDVGPTFACLFGEQFRRLKKGDSFWYERPNQQAFTEEQLRSIKQLRMSSLLCTNFNLGEVQWNPFELIKETDCQSVSTGENRGVGKRQRQPPGGDGGPGGPGGPQPQPQPPQPPQPQPPRQPCNPTLSCTDNMFRALDLSPWIN